MQVAKGNNAVPITCIEDEGRPHISKCLDKEWIGAVRAGEIVGLVLVALIVIRCNCL